MEFCTSCGQPLKDGAAFCTSCGAPKAHAGQTPAAPSAPAPAEVPTAPVSDSTAAIAPVPAEADAAPMPPMVPGYEAAQPAPNKARRALLLSSGALIVVAAIVVGLLFVFGVFKSNKGASNPEAAVSDLVNSVAALNPSQALTAIAPGEVSGFQELEKSAESAMTSSSNKSALANLETQMQSLQQSTGGASTGLPGFNQLTSMSNISPDDLKGALKAVSVKLTNLQYNTTNLASGLADVSITGGDLTVSADSSKIPASLKQKLSAIIGQSSNVPSWVNDLLSGNTTVSHTFPIGDWAREAASKGQKLDVIVVQQNGGWFVSLYGTIAQHVYEGVNYQRSQSGQSPLATPDWKLYANPPQAIVASSPEQVPANLAKAINDKSIVEILRNLPQNEVRTLYPYASLLQTAADQSDSTGSDETGAVSGVKATTTADGNLVHAIYTQGTLVLTKSDGSTETYAVNNGCYSSNTDGSTKTSCYSSWPGFVQTLASAFGVDKGIPITLQSVGGGYQFDPVASVLGLVSSAVSHSDKIINAVSQFMTYMQQEFAQLNSQYGSSSSGYGSSSCYDASGNYNC